MNEQPYKSIAEELQMSSFINDFQKAYLNLLFTANWYSVAIQKALKKHGLTNAQYNVLRILRGHQPVTMSAMDIQSRMIYSNSNVSRILEKLLEKGLIVSMACPENRRRNNVSITEDGLAMLERCEPIPLMIFEKMSVVISEKEAGILNNILEKLRQCNLDLS
ncbi:MAG TPA: MarR family transcriptional regulator [Edaphocola sp.]|nr:MarR family transcriptional regulator [Edaphocola sp.]